MTRILSLDDEPEMVGLYSLILEPKGYEHVGVSDSYEAWAMLCTESFDLFTQDLMRPDIDGWAFCGLMKADESLRDLPVMLISARSSDKDFAAIPKLTLFSPSRLGHVICWMPFCKC